MLHLGAIVFSILSWFATAFFISSFIWLDYNWYHLMRDLAVNGSFWLSVFFLVSLVIAKDVYIAAWKRTFDYGPLHIIQEVRRE